MEDRPFDLAALVIELIICMLVIGVIANLFGVSDRLVNTYQRELDTQYALQEYARYAKYDNALVTGGDVIGAIYEHTNDTFFISVVNGEEVEISPGIFEAQYESFVIGSGNLLPEGMPLISPGGSPYVWGTDLISGLPVEVTIASPSHPDMTADVLGTFQNIDSFSASFTDWLIAECNIDVAEPYWGTLVISDNGAVLGIVLMSEFSAEQWG
jgi:hypothetical protein